MESDLGELHLNLMYHLLDGRIYSSQTQEEDLSRLNTIFDKQAEGSWFEI